MLRLVDRHVWRAVDGCLLIAVLLLVLTIAVQVGSRLLNHSTPWTEELSRFLFIWTAFLGMATGFRSREHPRIEVVVGLLPAAWAQRLNYLTPICVACLFGIAGWFGIKLMLQQLRFGETSPAMGIGMWLVTLPIVIGSVLSIVGAFVSALLDDDAPATVLSAAPAVAATGSTL